VEAGELALQTAMQLLEQPIPEAVAAAVHQEQEMAPAQAVRVLLS
jgi:hypothetical protein